jgi:t-SNARE complex subunit (syntaxin)
MNIQHHHHQYHQQQQQQQQQKQQQQQIQIIEMDDQYYQSRSKEIQDVIKGVQEIAELTEDMKTLVLEQEEYIDIIDENINDTQKYVEEAEHETKEAYEDEPCCNKYLRYVLCGLGIIVVLLCGLLIVKFMIFRA